MNRINYLVRRMTVGQWVALVLVSLLIHPVAPLSAKTRKGEKLRAEAREEELRGNFDHALELAEEAIAQDPGDPSYGLELRRVRFEAAAAHVKTGQKLRSAGKLEEALAEFERAFGIDPASDIAAQEVRRTREMIQRNKTGSDSSAALTPEEKKILTPTELAKREAQDRTDSLLPIPELRPLNADPIALKMTNKPRVLFETVAKVAGINVLFDPEYNSQQTIPQAQIDLNNTTLEESLDQIAVITKSFWKPLSKNTIFVTIDNPTKRREYAEQVVKVFYLSNVTSPQEMQELLTVLRTVVDVQKVFNFTAQNALVVRAEADTMALVEKLIADLDKPRGEVIIDLMVMEVSSTYMRSLTAAFAPTGINTSAVFTPRPGITTPAGTTDTSGGSTTTTTTPSTSIPLANLGRISTSDYSLTTLPGATFEAVLNDSGTRVLQAPQIRAADKAKASIKIGDKVPTATGSFQNGIGGVGAGISPLVNTQFTFIDVGVNVEITPYVHDNNEVSLHVDLDVSQVKDRIDLGGVSEPEISQNKALADLRLKDGEVNLIGGIIQRTDSRAITGIPGLAGIPILGRLFSGETVQRDRTELVIAIVPHIVRGPDINGGNLKGIAAGNSTQIKVGYAPRKPAPVVAESGGPVAQGPPVTAPPVTAPLATAPPATAPPTFPPPSAAPPAMTPPATAPPDAAVPAAVPGQARVSFLPGNSVDAQLSQSVTVTVYAENVKDLAGAVAKLQFDPRIVRVTNIVTGDLPQRGGVSVQPSRNILNDSGTADVSFSRQSAISGSGGLFSIVLQAVGRGNTTLSLSGFSLRGVNGQPIPSNSPPALAVNVK
jgi:general secretion pathway protein D